MLPQTLQSDSWRDQAMYYSTIADVSKAIIDCIESGRKIVAVINDTGFSCSDMTGDALQSLSSSTRIVRLQSNSMLCMGPGSIEDNMAFDSSTNKVLENNTVEGSIKNLQGALKILSKGAPGERRRLLCLEDADCFSSDLLDNLSRMSGLDAEDMPLQLLYVGTPRYWELLQQDNHSMSRRRIAPVLVLGSAPGPEHAQTNVSEPVLDSLTPLKAQPSHAFASLQSQEQSSRNNIGLSPSLMDIMPFSDNVAIGSSTQVKKVRSTQTKHPGKSWVRFFCSLTILILVAGIGFAGWSYRDDLATTDFISLMQSRFSSPPVSSDISAKTINRHHRHDNVADSTIAEPLAGQHAENAQVSKGLPEPLAHSEPDNSLQNSNLENTSALPSKTSSENTAIMAAPAPVQAPVSAPAPAPAPAPVPAPRIALSDSVPLKPAPAVTSSLPSLQTKTEPAQVVQPVYSVDERKLAQQSLNRGSTMLGLHDMSAARRYFELAANQGNADAAVAMGKTYDPEFLSTTDAMSVQSDTATAAFWYRKAQALGSFQAIQLLRSIGYAVRD